MESSFNNNPIQPNKQRRLRAWLYEHGISFVQIGQLLGITGVGANKTLYQERMPVKHYDAVVKAYPHIPRELLPRPLNVHPGPKPKAEQTIPA